MMIKGRATPEGTRAYLGAQSPWVRKLGSTNLSVGALSFGTYRVDQGDPGHEQSLRQALAGGRVNLIDTACNYTGGQSEELIGRVFGEQVSAGLLQREAFVFVTKAGYLTDELLEYAREGGVPESSVTKLGHDHWHSFHPTVLDAAIPRSLERLGLQSVDVFLLHNPEYFFKSRGEVPIEELRDEFYRRVGEAFECLERWVEEGVIGAYGVSSNTLGFSSEDPQSTSLARFLETADSIAPGEHHLRVVQCPVNLLEREPLATLGTGGVGVLTNRPLNAIDKGNVYRLAQDFSAREAMRFRERARSLRDLERVFRKSFADRCGSFDVRTVFFVNELSHGLASFPTRVSLADYMTQTHMPRIRRLLGELDALFGQEAEFNEWRTSYWPALVAFARSAMAQLEQRDMKKIGPLFQRLNEELPASLQQSSWAQKAWWFCASRVGVSSVLVGARQPMYVEEIHDLAERWDE